MTEEQRLNMEHKRKFEEWCKMEEQRTAIIAANREKEQRIRDELSKEKINAERKLKEEEEAKYRKEQDEIRQKKEEETQQKLDALKQHDIRYKKQLLGISKQIAPCAKCTPFIRWTKEVKTWDWCRCYECKRTIEKTAKSKNSE
jgi:hypothetical protein